MKPSLLKWPKRSYQAVTNFLYFVLLLTADSFNVEFWFIESLQICVDFGNNSIGCNKNLFCGYEMKQEDRLWPNVWATCSSMWGLLLFTLNTSAAVILIPKTNPQHILRLLQKPAGRSLSKRPLSIKNKCWFVSLQMLLLLKALCL